MSAPVDVLAVMRGAELGYAAEGHTGVAKEMEEARAAVAELVEAAAPALGVIEDELAWLREDERRREIMDEPSLEDDIRRLEGVHSRLSAAIARVKGGAA